MTASNRVYTQRNGAIATSLEEIAAMQILEAKVESVAADIAEIKADLKTVTAGMERIIRLEEGRAQHEQAIGRAFNSITQHESRLSVLENDAPITKMIRNWVVAGVIGIVTMFGMQLYSMSMMWSTVANKHLDIKK